LFVFFIWVLLTKWLFLQVILFSINMASIYVQYSVPLYHSMLKPSVVNSNYFMNKYFHAQTLLFHHLFIAISISISISISIFIFIIKFPFIFIFTIYFTFNSSFIYFHTYSFNSSFLSKLSLLFSSFKFLFCI
jgi:hypothetical protein